jgi:activator of HSP90 ATPase
MNASASSQSSSYTRRQLIAGGAIGLFGVATGGVEALAQDASAGSQKSTAIIMTKAIHQEEDFSAKPQRIYDALLDARQFSTLTGFPGAEIHPEVGAAFSLFGGHVVGRNLKLSPNRLIVQAWRAADWVDGIYSIARFELIGQNSGTRIRFDHTGFPSERAEHLEKGWREHYWTTLRKYLA